MPNNRCSNCTERRAECTYVQGPVRAEFAYVSISMTFNMPPQFRIITDIPEGWSLPYTSLYILLVREYLDGGHERGLTLRSSLHGRVAEARIP